MVFGQLPMDIKVTSFAESFMTYTENLPTNSSMFDFYRCSMNSTRINTNGWRTDLFMSNLENIRGA